MTEQLIDISKQITLLLKHGRGIDGNRYSLSNVAKITGLRYQTLANLINGSSSNPRLETLRSLCRLYSISLDYFSCETEKACLDVLKHQIASNSSDIRDIDDETNHLSSKGKRNVMTIMEWMRRATQNK